MFTKPLFPLSLYGMTEMFLFPISSKSPLTRSTGNLEVNAFRT
jgi:hypothetical protein